LLFVGMGLGPLRYLTKAAEEYLRSSEVVYVDTYTSKVERELMSYIREIVKGRLIAADRDLLENRMKEIVEEARVKNVCIAVPGDPFIATTHVALREEARKLKVGEEIVFGVSAYTSAISLSGLHVYKFGKSASIPLTDDINQVRQSYYTLLENQSRGLHTLFFLDTKDGGLRAGKALELLLKVENEEGRGVVRSGTLVIVVARIGYDDATITAGRLENLINHTLPPPPHMLIFPGELHFTEKEVIKFYALNADDVERHAPVNYIRDRVLKYVEKTRRVLQEVRGQDVGEEFCNYVEAYVDDSKNFLTSGDYVNSLLAIGYAEGLLDALRLLGVVRFEW